MVRIRTLLVTMSVAFATIPMVARCAEVVVLKDGSRVEGQVTEGKSFVTVKVGTKRRLFKRSDIRGVLTPSMPMHERFLVDPKPRYLLLLASRAGYGWDMAKITEIYDKAFPDGPDRAAAQALLEMLRLTPDHTREAVEAHVTEFKKTFGAGATVHRSRHYVILTNKGPFWARKIAARMDGIFEEYTKRLVFAEKITDRFVIKVFSDRIQYIKQGGPPNSAAYFSAGRKELVGYTPPAEDLLFESLYHEGMHQFLHSYVVNPPRWFDEGLAQYFETARPLPVRSSKVPTYHVGSKLESESRAVRDAARSGNLIPLKKLMGMSLKEFYSGNMHMNYAEAWAFTHFLLESGNKQLLDLWKSYFFALRDGLSPQDAQEKVFGKIDFNALERMFNRYATGL